jgi:hypothetical protein
MQYGNSKLNSLSEKIAAISIQNMADMVLQHMEAIIKVRICIQNYK